MSNLYSKIHRLKAQGWTWGFFLQQIDLIYPAGIDEKTLHALYRQPHRKANTHVSKIILKLHDQQFPSPFPKDTQAILAIYNRLISCKQHLRPSQDIEDFLIFLDQDIKFGSNLRKARLHWLKADIHLDQLPKFRNNGQNQELYKHQQLALQHYQICYQILEGQTKANHTQGELQDIAAIDSFTLYKVQQNMLACYLNSLHAENRYQNTKLLDYLSNSNFVNASKSVLHTEPYQWIIARNGLRFSSIIKHKNDCEFFYQALVKSNKAFADLNYAPNGAPAINQSTEFIWAIQNSIK